MVINYFKLLMRVVVVTLLFSSCGNNSSLPPVERVAEFSLPEIPTMVSDAEQRKEYLATHYWDRYDFADSLLVYSDSLTGMAVAGYINVLAMASDTLVKSKAISHALSAALDSPYSHFNKFFTQLEHYLYNPNSPMRDEELYLLFVSYLVESNRLDEVELRRYIFQRDMLLKNRVGAIATDFGYSLKSGKSSTLHKIKSLYTILFFNNPDCEDCGRVKEYIANSEVIGLLYDAGKITILGVYSESDLEAWYKGQYPDMVINSYDKDHHIATSNLYDLRAIPTLYLLDEQKRVILKDAPIEQIERWLSQK